jgi:hypothetical protein
MRAFLGLALLAVTQPLQAVAVEGTRNLDYEDEVTRDGYWKIEARSRRGDASIAIDVALYRAAELARAAGHQYVEMHDAFSRRNRHAETALLFARGADAPVHPAQCRSGRARRCYTADVRAVIRQLSGASGNEPGVAAPSHIDQYGRTVFQSGFGIGAVSPR